MDGMNMRVLVVSAPVLTQTVNWLPVRYFVKRPIKYSTAEIGPPSVAPASDPAAVITADDVASLEAVSVAGDAQRERRRDRPPNRGA
jgi:hypothetical protein